MSNHPRHKNTLILAIAPTTRGFGFAVLGKTTLADWGTTSIRGNNKNVQVLRKVEKLIAHYMPEELVLQDAEAKEDHRCPRIQKLTRHIVSAASKRRLQVTLLSREQVRLAFFEDGKATKHNIAGVLARRYPDELGFCLPPKRRPWMSEDGRMDIFDAVALALTLRMGKGKRVSRSLTSGDLAPLRRSPPVSA